MKSPAVGDADGELVLGLPVGEVDGVFEGESVVGLLVGLFEGDVEGATVGFSVG